MEIKQEEYKILCDYIYKISGIHLDESKGYLLETRLKPILLSNGLDDYTKLINSAKSDKTRKLQEKIIDAISTNETFFFRDKTPFNLLQHKIIPDLLDKRHKLYKSNKIPLKILSAACSTGQEVYSIAITLIEVIPNIQNYDINIMGIDIADDVIAKASYGKYNKFEVERGMEQRTLKKYFNKVEDGWRINDRVRSMANFKKVNLMDNITNLGVFDIIFCRNVAIYFRYNDKVKLFKKLAGMMEPDGYLIVGGSESLSGIAPDFKANHYLNGIFYSLKSDSPEATKEVKLFKAITPGITNSTPVKKVRKAKKTIENRPQKLTIKNDTKFTTKIKTLNRLKKKQDKVSEISTQLNMKIKKDEIPDKQISEMNNSQAEDKKQNVEPVEEKKKTYRQILAEKKQNTNPLLSSIQNKTSNSKPLVLGKKEKSSRDSLLSKLNEK